MDPTQHDPLRDTGPHMTRGGELAAALADELIAAIDAGREPEYLRSLATRVRAALPDVEQEELGFDRPEGSSVFDAIRSAGLKLLSALPKERRHAAAVDVRTLPLVELALRLPELAQEIADTARPEAHGGNASQLTHVLSQVTKEIRGPLHEIVEELGRLARTDLTMEQRERVETADECAQAVLHLANDLSDLAQLQGGRFATAMLDFHVRDCIAAALHAVDPRARSRAVVLQHAVAPAVPSLGRGDPGRLRHVLSTLVGNAAGAMRGGTLLVSVTVHDRDEDSVVLRTTIQAAGGAPRRRQSGETGAALWRGASSSGLGLSIARQLVAQMGGRTWVETATGGGSALNFTVRLGTTRAQEHRRGELSITPLQGLRVLVVEPHSGLGSDVIAALRNAGADLDVSRSGDDARARIVAGISESRRHVVALLCTGLDDRAGRAAAESLAGMEAEQRPPLAVISPNGQRGDATLCRRIGVTAYLTQPVGEQDLQDVVSALLDEGLAADIRRHGLLTRHFLRELRGRLQLAVIAADAEKAMPWAVRLEALGHRAALATSPSELSALVDETPPDALVLLAGDAPSGIGSAVDQARRRLGLLGNRRLPLVQVGEPPESDLAAGRIDAQVAEDASDETLAVAIAEITRNTGKGSGGHRQIKQLLDMEALLRRLNNDRRLVGDVVALFLRDVEPMLAAVREAAHAGDGDRLLRAADTLKGSFEIFNVRAGADLCARLASAGRSEDFSEADKLLQRLETVSASLCAELRALQHARGSAA